jgi:phage-related protein
MKRNIIFYEKYFIEFYLKQEPKVKEKIQYVFELIRQVDRVPEKFLKHVTATEVLYEIRIKFQSNIYRIFCCFDEGQIVVLFNGFQKKTIKIPQNEIAKAQELMKEYFQNKER